MDDWSQNLSIPGDAACEDLEDLIARAKHLSQTMRTRRSTRHFSTRPVPREVIRSVLEIAVSAPSGINKQAWRFVAIERSASRRLIREVAEEEEARSHEQRANVDWLKVTQNLGLPKTKRYLEDAPWLIAVYVQETSDAKHSATKLFVYESAAIATGFLVSALHTLGLDSLVHAPVAGDLIGEISGKGDDEHMLVLVLAGYRDEAASAGSAPAISKKSLHAVAEIIGGSDW